MATLFLIFLLSLAINSPPSSSTPDTLSRASSLSVEKLEDVLISPDGVFTAGFHQVGNNSYCFAIWFSEPSPSSDRHQNPTVVWTANRDRPVNGKRSKLSLLKTGNLILTDAGQSIVWATTTTSLSPAHLTLHTSGNLILQNSDDHVVLWQSFDSPTDTLLPLQPFTRNAMLVSTRSQSNSSSGFYKLFFDNDNLLRLLFDGLEVSSVYWPDPSRVSWDNERSTYNNTRTAMLDSLGSFVSSDNLTFMSTDYGARLQRMLRIDFDGNVRLYSRERAGEKWVVSWQAISDPCKVHGTCGANSVCSYDRGFGRKCLCLPGYQMRNHTDWSFGCEPQFDLSYTEGNESSFLKLSQVEFNGYDFNSYTNYSYMECESICLKLDNCKGFQYTFDRGNGFYNCNPKTQLRSGHMSDSQGYLYLRLPKAFLLSNGSGIKAPKDYGLICTDRDIDLNRNYVKNHVSKPVKFLLWFACGVGGFEIVCLLLFLCLLNSRTRKNSNEDMQQGYLLAATGFKRFSYAELKKATRGFSEEIGRGAGGFVYKGVLDDERIAAVKLLNEAIQGEAEFLAEVSTLGRLNHMHLIEMWGYCSEGKHKLLVYEYMEHGSLAQNLSSNVLDWEKRFEIAVGTAKGLAYLHEECLEWVLHCDVKPQNILLDSNYQPKVADFGLSKLFNRGELKNSSFSRIRGTRGYIAPEWVYNLPITSKVDVYSYGIVVLEMVTGKNPMMGGDAFDGEQRRLISWMREKVNGTSSIKPQIEEIIDSSFEGEYNVEKVEVLLKVALHCVEEDKDARPTMRQVVEMLLHLDKDC
ncbi:receptor protein kinase ZmPK1 [Pyrus ussuriensis x Pyrus communis]|uniref:Receptor-like serine/threonine-protein kinase n=1 Tax=Pyrus ussuriensis x Pyrus communis TaxID=2448454 RepID=A0A5N5H265_9ROSA|nr:receptor protein kinase ZmPK1 [Pyrus ussuriensis x Pyrus communis]